jgi:hypothetical protein
VTCQHRRIVTWMLEDGETAGLWSCAHCHRKFEPVAPRAPQAPMSEVPPVIDGAGAAEQDNESKAREP